MRSGGRLLHTDDQLLPAGQAGRPRLRSAGRASGDQGSDRTIRRTGDLARPADRPAAGLTVLGGLSREADATFCQLTCCRDGGVRAFWGRWGMRSPSERRDRAARYVTLAITARRNGDIRLACMLMDRVARLMELADAAEAGQIAPPPSSTSSVVRSHPVERASATTTNAAKRQQ